MEHASVVIVGGGVIGASIAFHLAEAGVEDVMLVEQAELGSGSTGKGAGGVRAMFSDELNVRIGLRSLEAWRAFGERPGWAIDLRRVGYLFLLSSTEHVAEFERSIEMQNRLGVPSRMVSVEKAAELSPLAGMEGVLAGAFCPLAGHATPDGAVQGYASAARALGARVETHTMVTGIGPGAVAMEARRRGDGESVIEAGCVVCAAGPWSRAIGALAGVELPVTPQRRRIAYTAPLAIDAEPPMTIDFATGFYFHGEGRGLLFGTNDVCETQDEWLERARAPRRSDRRRLVGRLRDDAGPQCPDRGGRGGPGALPLRDGLLGARLPSGTRRRRGSARPLPGAGPVRGRLRPRGGATRAA